MEKSNSKMSSRLTRNCKKCPKEVQRLFAPEEIKLLSDIRKAGGKDGGLSSESLANENPENFVDPVNHNQLTQEEAKKMLAKAIYSSGAPLAFFENENWIEFFKIISPSLELPCRRKLSRGLLNEQFNSMNAYVENEVSKADNLGLRCYEFINESSHSQRRNYIPVDEFTYIMLQTPNQVLRVKLKQYEHTVRYPESRLIYL